MIVVDLVDLYFSLRFGKVELLHDRIILVNILCFLNLSVLLVPVLGVGDGIA